MLVTEFEASAFDGFDKQWFCSVVITLLFIKHSQVVLSFQRFWMGLTKLAQSSCKCLFELRFGLFRFALRHVQLGQGIHYAQRTPILFA
jgi:hypothetical protein